MAYSYNKTMKLNKLQLEATQILKHNIDQKKLDMNLYNILSAI